MIPAVIQPQVAALQAAAAAARPIAQAPRLQIAALVAQGQAVLRDTDAALLVAGGTLDQPDPAGHPLAMIAAVRARVAAAEDAVTLSDLRGFLGRAVLNLGQATA